MVNCLPKKGALALGLTVLGAFVLGGCSLYQPRVLVALPDQYSTPSGATLDQRGNILLACLKLNNSAQPHGAPKPRGVIVKLDAQNGLTEFYAPPVHPDTGRSRPMGMDFGPDGHLYVADNQWSRHAEHRSRLLRIKIVDGKPVGCDVVVEGLRAPNAVVRRGYHVYVSDATRRDAKTMRSGIFRFSIRELSTPAPVQLRREGRDRHLVAEMPTKGPAGFAAGGLTFDPKGNLYCGSLADGTIRKIALDMDGSVLSNKLWFRATAINSCAGLFYDRKSNRIYVADMVQNAIHAVSLDAEGTTVLRNGDTDGADGGLDQPCDVLVRGDELVVVNRDMPFQGAVNTKSDKPHTLSAIKLQFLRYGRRCRKCKRR